MTIAWSHHTLSCTLQWLFPPLCRLYSLTHTHTHKTTCIFDFKLFLHFVQIFHIAFCFSLVLFLFPRSVSLSLLQLPDPCFGINLYLLASPHLLVSSICLSALLLPFFQQHFHLASLFFLNLFHLSRFHSLSVWQTAEQQRDRLYLARRSFSSNAHAHTHTCMHCIHTQVSNKKIRPRFAASSAEQLCMRIKLCPTLAHSPKKL